MRTLFVTLLTVFLVQGLLAADNIEKKIFVHAVDHYALGVAIMDVDNDHSDKKNVEGGAQVVQVFDDSEADEIGLKKDDIITQFDGVKVSGAEQLSDQVDKMVKPKKVKLEILRNGKSKSFTANLRKPEKDSEHEIKVDIDGLDLDIDIPELPRAPRMLHFSDNDKGGFLGVEAKNLGEQLRTYFDVKSGVLIEAVVDESPAAKAGLKAGDVITKIDDRDIEDYSDLVRTLNFYNPGEKVTVDYVRKGKKKDVKVELAEKEHKIRIKKIQRFGDDDDDVDELIWQSKDDLRVLKEELKNVKEEHGKILKEIKLKIFVI